MSPSLALEGQKRNGMNNCYVMGMRKEGRKEGRKEARKNENMDE
jgi:hypothetical protein